MRFAKIGERVKIKNNKNGAYKDMTGEVIWVFISGTATVAIDPEFHKILGKVYSHKPNILLGNYEVLAKISGSILEVE